MYAAQPFRQAELPILHDQMRDIGFATLAIQGQEGLTAVHVPLELDTNGPTTILRGHVARPNPFWRDVGDGRDVLAMFLGANGYVTPQWYPSKKEHGRAVPTWNYIAVHATGRIVPVKDSAWLLRHLKRLSNHHEAGTAEPWAISDAPEDFIARMTEGIVGLEITVTKIEGIQKLNQNRSAIDRAGVASGLQQRGHANDRVMAALIAESLT